MVWLWKLSAAELAFLILQVLLSQIWRQGIFPRHCWLQIVTVLLQRISHPLLQTKLHILTSLGHESAIPWQSPVQFLVHISSLHEVDLTGSTTGFSTLQVAFLQYFSHFVFLPQVREHVAFSMQVCLHIFTSSVHFIVQSSPPQICLQVSEEQVNVVFLGQLRQFCSHFFTLLPHFNNPHDEPSKQYCWHVLVALPQSSFGQILSFFMHDWMQELDCCEHVSSASQTDNTRLTTVTINGKWIPMMFLQ